MKRTLLICALGLLACCTAVAQRLPGGATPDHYTLQFTIHFANNSFDGDELSTSSLTSPRPPSP